MTEINIVNMIKPVAPDARKPSPKPKPSKKQLNTLPSFNTMCCETTLKILGLYKLLVSNLSCSIILNGFIYFDFTDFAIFKIFSSILIIKNKK
jgi:hypothetical protein